MDFKNFPNRALVRAASGILASIPEMNQDLQDILRQAFGGNTNNTKIIQRMFGNARSARGNIAVLADIAKMSGTDVHSLVAQVAMKYSMDDKPDVMFFVKLFITVNVMLRDLEYGVDKDVAVNKASTLIQAFIGKRQGMYKGVKLTMPEEIVTSIYQYLDQAIEESKTTQPA